jgi:hypothetical protein
MEEELTDAQEGHADLISSSASFYWRKGRRGAGVHSIAAQSARGYLGWRHRKRQPSPFMTEFRKSIQSIEYMDCFATVWLSKSDFLSRPQLADEARMKA